MQSEVHLTLLLQVLDMALSLQLGDGKRRIALDTISMRGSIGPAACEPRVLFPRPCFHGMIAGVTR